MDLRKVLLQENSKAKAMQVADYVGSNAKRFKELVEIFLRGPYRVTQRASWPLNICVEKHPQLLAPHLKAILKVLKAPDVHDAVKRNVFRMLQYGKIPKQSHESLIELGFQFLTSKKEAVAIKVFAMEIVSRIVVDYPELQKELIIIIEDQMAYASPAFTSRARKVLKKTALNSDNEE